MIVDKRSPLPLYYQLKEWLRGQIEDNTLTEGAQVPPEMQLSEQFGLSRGTVRQAINELVAEGLLYRVQGHGTFVSSPKVEYGMTQVFHSLAEDMRERSQPFTSTLLSSQTMQASGRVAARLKLGPTEQVILLERLGCVADEPSVIATTYLPASLCSPVLDEDLTDKSLYEVLEQRCGVHLYKATRTLELAQANEYEAEMLHVPIGSPIHLMQTIAYLDNGRPIEYSKLRFRGDRSKFVFEMRRS